MNKAFLFDLDGVLVDSESTWVELEREFLPQLFGKDVAAQMGDLVGIGVDGVLERARELGAVCAKSEYLRRYSGLATLVYAQSPITEGIDALVEKLIQADFKIGLVSQSPLNWIGQVVPRLSFKDSIGVTISLHDRPDLKEKPAPDGFIEAMRILEAEPKHSIVLEDSNGGIAAGKASGAFTIGYRGNLIEGYKQTGADAHADTMDDVIRLVEETVS